MVDAKVSPLRPAAALLVTVALLAACSGAGAGRSRLATTTSTAPAKAEQVVPAQVLAGKGQPSTVYDFSALLAGGLDELSTSVSPDALAAVAVGPIAVDFMNLVERVEKQSYSVGYRARGELVAELPSELAFTIVHTTQTTKNAGTAGPDLAVESIVTGSDAIVCQKVGAWSCKREKATSEPITAASLLYVSAVFVQSPGAFEMSDYKTSIVGVPVRCIKGTPLATDAASMGTVELCVTGEGVPLRVEVPELVLEGVWYQPSVAKDAFVPPAAVQ